MATTKEDQTERPKHDASGATSSQHNKAPQDAKWNQARSMEMPAMKSGTGDETTVAVRKEGGGGGGGHGGGGGGGVHGEHGERRDQRGAARCPRGIELRKRNTTAKLGGEVVSCSRHSLGLAKPPTHEKPEELAISGAVTREYQIEVPRWSRSAGARPRPCVRVSWQRASMNATSVMPLPASAIEYLTGTQLASMSSTNSRPVQ